MADWTPLDDGDPMPGNPEGLADLVARLRREAADMRSAVDRLNAVNSEEFWEGDAATAFAEGRRRAVPDLDMVAHRIETSANALSAFVPAMGDCHTRGNVAVRRARDADEAIAKANLGLDDAVRQAAADKAAADAWSAANPGQTPPPPPAYWGPNWHGLLEEAQQERSLAATLFRQAVDDYDAAATRCAQALDAAVNDALRNPHHHGVLGGIVHGVEGLTHSTVHAVENAGKAVVDAGEWLGHETLEHLDNVSDLLGVAAMLTGFFPPFKSVSLGLAGAKMAVDAVAVLAGKGDWSKVRDDAIGFALYGFGRGVTGFARSKVGLAAAAKVARDTNTMRETIAETAEGEEAVQRTLKIARLRVNVRRTNEIVKDFSEDAPRSLMRETVAMIRDPRPELPSLSTLSLSRGALIAAGAVKGLETDEHYNQYKELRELNEKYEVLPGTKTE